MKLKKLLSIILCASVVLCFGACSNSGGEDKTTTTTKAEEVTTAAKVDPFEGVDLTNTLVLALNVMYNDVDAAYFGNEVGPAIQVKGEGQYTVTFDCSKDLSDAAKLAAMKSLTNLTAIYIKDYATTAGKLAASNLVSCDIMYDKVVVDGVELTVTQTEPKSAIKSNGIFDTNDPINGWDGSAVAEADITDADNHVANFTTLTNPKTIEVTFTLSNLVFAE
ncbi:MAG: hypothetical protein E7266_06810 [Lachnospiraceae bacterium]|nr:hypothetical protein [Lachnospiraceae bacterium]